MRNYRFLALILLMGLLLSACGASAQTAAPTEPPLAVPSATNTQPPTATFTSTCTNTPEFTPTFTQTIGPTPTPTADFSQIQLVAVGPHTAGLLISFHLPQLIGNLRAVINGRDYACITDESDPTMLYCYGQSFKTPVKTDVAFYPADSDQLLYQAQFLIPAAISVKPTPVGNPATWCPDRGKNVTCETECRLGPNGPCKVMTCFDACGYYYSEHTCPENMPLPSPMSDKCD